MLKKYKVYLNLTNGIEALCSPPSDIKSIDEFSFIRIQSTACEQKLWDKLFLELDYDFLFNAAIGNTCIVIDYGANKPIPRAIYQGLEFIKYVLNRYWYGIDAPAFIKRSRNTFTSVNVTAYFREEYSKLSISVLKKLDYFKPYLLDNCVTITALSDKTIHDGDKQYYSNIIKKLIS